MKVDKLNTVKVEFFLKVQNASIEEFSYQLKSFLFYYE